MKTFMLSLSLLASVAVGGVAQANEGLPTTSLSQSDTDSAARPRFPLRRHVCLARNASRGVFRGVSFNRFMARREALNSCQRGSLFFLRRTCRIVYCR